MNYNKKIRIAVKRLKNEIKLLGLNPQKIDNKRIKELLFEKRNPQYLIMSANHLEKYKEQIKQLLGE